MKRSISTPPSLNASLATTTSLVVDLDTVEAISVQVNYVDDAPAAKTFTSGAVEVQTLTYEALAGSDDGDFVIVETAAGVKYALALDTTGAAATAPAGALWTAVDASRRALVDISAATDAASVAAAAETAWNLLPGFTAAITSDDTAADGTMTFTQVAFGPTTNPVPKNALESGAGGILGVQTTAGVATTLDLDDNLITIAAHPYVTGTKVAATTSAADFPAGLSATNYYVIVVDADTVSLASSLANAVAGTAVNITDEGTGTHTLTAATSSGNVYKLQSSNDNANWTDVASKTVTITTSSGTAQWDIDRPAYRYLKLLYTPSAGQIALETIISQVI
jgi:hypothetical protein